MGAGPFENKGLDAFNLNEMEQAGRGIEGKDVVEEDGPRGQLGQGC